LQALLEHLIISHHGKYEFGSPKLPMFPEALLLHQLDDMDSKMQAMRSQLQGELPQLELECLAALWALERAPVAEVHARLASRGRPLAYTTILTVLDRLRRK